jgi:hypothetical protein
MNLVAQAQNWIQDEDSIAANANNFVSGPAGVSGDDDTDESDYEPSNFILIDDRTGTDQPPPHTRGTNITPHAHGRPRASSDSSGRPRKRRRHHVTSPSNVARQTRAAPVNSPLNAMDRFEKELLSELTCEICFTLMYQPVTTPCQHVSAHDIVTDGDLTMSTIMCRVSVRNVCIVAWIIAKSARCVDKIFQNSHIFKITLAITRSYPLVRSDVPRPDDV